MNWLNILYPAVSIGGLGLIFGLGLGVASKKFAVEVNPLIPEVRDSLPGANCGGCGYPGCDGFAKGVVEDAANINGCPVGGSETANKIAALLGMEKTNTVKKVAYIMCSGTNTLANNKYDYIGIKDCHAANNMVGKGFKTCSHGCLGLGSCKNVCAFGAIYLEDGIAKIDEDLCVACGKCVEACPKMLIDIVPLHKRVRVSCKSLDKGKQAKSACSVACIGCRLCVKSCEFDAITVTNNIATIDYSLCTQCGKCVEKCPVNAINSL